MKFSRVKNREKTEAHEGSEVFWHLMVDGVQFAEGEVFFKSPTSRRWNVRGSIPLTDGTEVSVNMDTVPSANKTYESIEKILEDRSVTSESIDFDALRARNGEEIQAEGQESPSVKVDTDDTSHSDQGQENNEGLRWRIVDTRDNSVVDSRESRRKAQARRKELGEKHYVVRDAEKES